MAGARSLRRSLHAATFGDYLAACALVAATSVLCEQVRPYLSPINMVMAYLLAVVLAAVRLGLKPAILAASLGVLAFDFFFVPPRFSLRTSDTEYLITFLALFTVGVVISSLVARGREGAEALRLREQLSAFRKQTRALPRLRRRGENQPCWTWASCWRGCRPRLRQRQAERF